VYRFADDVCLDGLYEFLERMLDDVDYGRIP